MHIESRVALLPNLEDSGEIELRLGGLGVEVKRQVQTRESVSKACDGPCENRSRLHLDLIEQYLPHHTSMQSLTSLLQTSTRVHNWSFFHC